MSSAKDTAEMRKTQARVDLRLEAERAAPVQPAPTRAARGLNARTPFVRLPSVPACAAGSSKSPMTLRRGIWWASPG